MTRLEELLKNTKHHFQIVMETKEKHPKRVKEVQPVWVYCTFDDALEQAKEFWKEHGSREDWRANLSIPA